MVNAFTDINNKNNINNNNINLNNKKISILNCLMLLYANERLIKKILFSNTQNGEIFNCYLVNKDFINNIKDKYYYSNINNILSTYNCNYDDFNIYILHLVNFQSLDEIKEILKKIKDIDSINKIRILPIRKKFKNYNECKDCKWPINFELVHEILYNKLLNIYKKSEEMNEIKVFQSQYKIYFGYSTLYINYRLFNIIY